MSLNEQTPPHGILWTRLWGRKGFTLNPMRGCKHGCRWEIGGHTVRCYAETAVGLREFQEYRWYPERLAITRQIPAGIFVGSMADVFGSGVPEEHIEAVLDMMRRAPQHVFFTLTKNAPRMLKFDLPNNLWAGVSSPPTFMHGKPLSGNQQWRMLEVSLKVLGKLDVPVRWLNLEPLSLNAIPLLAGAALDWVVIGAASQGRQTFQPPAYWVRGLLWLLDEREIPVMMKSGLEWPDRRTEFPVEPVPPEPVGQLRLFE